MERKITKKDVQEYIRNLEEYYLKMLELRVSDASDNDYFVCQVCQLPSSGSFGFWCECEASNVCFRCVGSVTQLRVFREICSCKLCGVKATIPQYSTSPVKPKPPF
jgi:hypothetical protein